MDGEGKIVEELLERTSSIDNEGIADYSSSREIESFLTAIYTLISKKTGQIISEIDTYMTLK